MTMNSNSTVLRTVQRAIDIINCFSFSEQELSLTEISQKIKLAKSTTTRLLATLEQNDYVQRNPLTSKYNLGKKLYFIGQIASKSFDIKEVAKKPMEQLRDQTQETVSLYVLENDYRVCIQRYGTTQSVGHIVKIGEKLPLWAGAAGKILLAYQSTEFINLILKNLDSSRIKKLEEEIPVIKKEQCAISLDERGVGVSAVAYPIFDMSRRVIACLAVSGPSTRFTSTLIYKLKDKLKDEGLIISKELDYKI